MNFSDFGVPPGPFGGVLGGCIVPGAPEVWSVTFFCLLCLNDNNYSKIFQKVSASFCLYNIHASKYPKL